VSRTVLFFGRAERAKGTACFLGGLAVLLAGWPILGILLQLYGTVALFGGFLPLAVNFLRCVPLVS
jgi:hypothetical protein